MHDAKNCLVERYVPHGMDIFEMFADLSYSGSVCGSQTDPKMINQLSDNDIIT